MFHNENDHTLSPKLTVDDIAFLKQCGEIIQAKDKQIVQSEGEKNRVLFVVLSGLLRVSRRFGNTEEFLRFIEVGEFSGDLGVLTNQVSLAKIQCLGPCELLRLEHSSLRKLIAENASLAEILLTTLSRRVRQFDGQVIQEEKLAALGKMAAGLAHELNNPATAARRASKLMFEALVQTPIRMLAFDKNFTEEERNSIHEFALTHMKPCTAPPLDPLEQSDREQELYDWLEQHEIPRPDEIAPVLAEGGMSTAELIRWQTKLPKNFTKGIFWLETVLRLSSLAHDIETSTDRIAELVGALKEYSYMDQAHFQEVNIHHDLENTLKIMHHKLKHGVAVKREYDSELPKICGYAGELNQVWTNLIDNAVDAMDGSGTLTLRSRHCKTYVYLEFADTGKGIPDAIRNRIFEPFFTTKQQGKGTGLGLDISYRIVVYRHGGCIRVRSKPGETVFEVQLPIRPLKEAEILASVQQQEA